MRRPKISRRAETRPYGRVSAPTRNCRRFLTQLMRGKVAACLAQDREVLLTFYGFPAEHWPSIRTTVVDLRHHPTSHASDVGLPDSSEHTAHDLQNGTVCEKPVATVAGIPETC